MSHGMHNKDLRNLDLEGKVIVQVGNANIGGIEFPVLKLNDGRFIVVQSDWEGNDAGVLVELENMKGII